MIEATGIVTTGQAWYEHWMAVAGQWSVLLGLAMGVIRFYHSWQKERQEDAVWRGRMEERVKCLERRD